MNKYLLSVSLILSALCGKSQENKVPDHFKNMSMRSIGPAVMSGRVTAIDVSDNDENTFYVGTASGGLWKSESAGVTWEPLFDEQEVIGIGSVCVDPTSPDIVWVGTGEGNPRNSQTSGGGVYKSLDAGRTWKKAGLEKSYTVHRMIVNPKNSDVVYAGVHGSAWGPSEERGVFKTSDGGMSWQKVLYVNDSVGCADLVMDPTNSHKLFAAMYQYQRKPYHFKSGGPGSGLHVTTDDGKTWTRLTNKNGLPEGDLGRIGIAIAPSNPKIVYALIESKKTGLYKSVDGGFQWTLITTKTVVDRPFYYNEIYVDPKNENHLIYLHSIVSESIDGGNTWTTLIAYGGVHPDHHAFWWSEKNSDFMLEGNDGGMNISHDGGNTWTFVNNLPLGQFYHINYDMDLPYHVYGGMQDNGSWKGSAYVWHGGGIRAADWQEVLFGDGFDVVPQPGNSRYVYAMSQGGEINFVDSETGDTRNIKPVHPEGKTLRFHWNAGLAEDPFNSKGAYFGSQFLHHTIDCGLSWEIISPDLTTNDSTKLKQAESGGLTIDNTSAENHCTILCIAPSALDKNLIWVGTDDGNIQMTRDGGKSWKNCTPSISGMPSCAWVPQIVCGTKQAGEAFVVVNNYRQNDWKPYLFHTTDYGATWKNLVNEKMVNGHCLSVVQDPVESRLIFLGTEHGLYVSFDAGASWKKWTHQYPSVATQDLKIHPRENDLIIGTFGRAAYILDDITPLRKYAGSGESSFNKKLIAMPTPDSYNTAYSQQSGERFPADQTYSGANKSGGAILSYYFQILEEPKKKEDTKKKVEKKDKSKKEVDSPADVKKEGKEEKEEKKKTDDKVTIYVKNFSGDTLRIIKQEPDTGLNYLSWYYDTKGIQFPTSRERKSDADEPGGGMKVYPGKYKVIYKNNEFKDSSEFTVLADPRIEWREDAYLKKKAFLDRLKKAAELADAGLEQLKSAEKTIELYTSILVNVPDSVKKPMISKSDSLTKKITTLKQIYLRTEERAGYTDDSDKLISKLYNASGYANQNGIGRNAEDCLKTVESDTRIAVDKINDFFEKEWNPWKEEVEKTKYSLFKEIKKL